MFGLGHIESKTKANVTMQQATKNTDCGFDEPDSVLTLPTTNGKQKRKQENLDGRNSVGLQFIEKKTSKFLQLVVSIFLSILVFVPVIVGGFYNHHYMLPDGFAILVPDPAASKNELYMTMVKVYPVNSGTNEDTIGSYMSCESYFKNPSLSNSPRIVYADLCKPECEKHLTNEAKFKEKMTARENKDVLLIAENWKHGSSSPFPSTTFDEKSETFTDTSIAHLKSYVGIPILSFNSKDKEGFERRGMTETQEIRIVMKGITDLLKPDSVLLSVECDEGECIHIDTDHDELMGNEVFLGCDSEPKRNVNVTISCNDRGKPW